MYCCSCLVCIAVSCLVCIVVVVLCVLLPAYVYLLYYVCITVCTLDAGLLARCCWHINAYTSTTSAFTQTLVLALSLLLHCHLK